jgi:hypothetical protein
VTSTGIAGDELAVIVRAIIQAAPVLGLSEEDAVRIASNAQLVEGELANDQLDAGVVRTFMQRILATLSSATDSALGLVLGAYAKWFMRKVGIPLD